MGKKREGRKQECLASVTRRKFLGAAAAAGAALALGKGARANATKEAKAMTEGKQAMSAAQLEEMTGKWWSTTVLDASGKCVYDDEVKAVNAMTARIDTFPEWALKVRGAMPMYGFEMCSHRWLDGLDDVLRMVGTETYFETTAGHCGDVPGRVSAAAEQRAAAAQAWIDGQPKADALGAQVAKRLGERTPEKVEAATCFVELVRTYFGKGEDKALTAKWRARTEKNETIKLMLARGGLIGLLENACGFQVIDGLDIYLRMIGGDRSEEGERHGVCNGQLRFVLRDDAPRFDITRGYLWGLQAYLLGRDENWLRGSKPDCAGAAIYALRTVSRAGEATPLRRWLAASLLKSTKIWCQCVLKKLGESAPAYARDLPKVKEAARA